MVALPLGMPQGGESLGVLRLLGRGLYGKLYAHTVMRAMYVDLLPGYRTAAGRLKLHTRRGEHSGNVPCVFAALLLGMGMPVSSGRASCCWPCWDGI